MDEFEKSKLLKVLFIVFIIVSAIHILYASITFRGLYCDGAYYMMKQLNWLSNGIHNIAFDDGHPRYCAVFITQLPVIIAHWLFFIKGKFALMFIYSFFQFLIPFAALFWSYNLAKRTEKPDIFFWNLFTYGAIILLYQIFSITESIFGIAFHFILWNYLSAKMEYKKRDLVGIIFLIIMMFGTFEYVAYLGIFFFLCHFYYVLQDNSVKNQAIKTLIGFGSLAASVFTIWFMLHTSGESGEALRFIGEGINVMPQAMHLNFLFLLAAVILIIIFAFKRTNMKIREALFVTVVFFLILRHLLSILDISLVPMWEQHFRTIPCWWLMLVFLIIHIKDLFRPTYNLSRWHNLICIMLICSIFQTFWQMTDTYYWNKNIQFMKEELAKVDSPLFIPTEHEEISSFVNDQLHRYIWHGIYAVTSILFSDTYEQKTLLVNYDVQQDEGNGNFRNLLFVSRDEPNKISLPFGVNADIKNHYWDLTECAKALDEYNKKHHIETDG